MTCLSRLTAVCALLLTALAISAVPGEGARGDITLLGSMSLPNSVFVSDVWGWVDPVDSREYAVIGDWTGKKLFIVDVTDPSDMTIASEVASVPGFDVKVWDHYAYVCDGDPLGKDSRVIDIADPFNPVVWPLGFFSAHNISVSSAGMMFLEFPGLRALDLATDPLAPALLFESITASRDGHDSTPRGNRLYDFRGQVGTIIWDVTNPAVPVELGRVTDPSIVYHHSGDASADGTTLLINDELASGSRADITIWDISDPLNPLKRSEINDTGATVHNLYIEGGLAYVSYYSSGFKVIDVSNPDSPVLLDRWDTSPLTGEGFIGAFGVYPFAPGNRVYVSDIDNGLFVFAVDTSATAAPSGPTPDTSAQARLEQNVPNPFNPSTTIRYELTQAQRVLLAVYNVRGKRIRRLVDSYAAAGTHETHWDGRDESGRRASSGVYFYRLHVSGETQTRRMVLLK